MGIELAGRLSGAKGDSAAVKADFASDHVTLRGAAKGEWAYRDIRAAAVEGTLAITHGAAIIVFDAGPQAAKLAERIAHPPSVLDKLGIKPGTRIQLAGAVADTFAAEAGAVGAVSRSAAAAHVILFGVEAAAQLGRAASLATKLGEGAALWIVYPKGVAAVGERDVLDAGRAAGLKDVKVARVSATHTGLKFVRPAD